MPWHITVDHPSCDQSHRYAVVKDADGELEGCHMSRDAAETQMAALYAAEQEATVMTRKAFDEITSQVFGQPVLTPSAPNGRQAAGGRPSKGTPADRRLKRNRGKPTYTDQPAAVPQGWEGTMVVEGTPTGDGRRFAAGSLSWPDPATTPIPLQWQKETSHGGDTDVTVNVGTVTDISRGPEGRVTGRGVIDTGTDDGAEVARRLVAEGRLGVSIVADDPDRAEVEFVYADGCPTDGPTLEGVLSGEVDDRCLQADEVIFHSGRIRALTVVDTPAFVEAQIHPADVGTPSAGMVAAAVGSHSTATATGSWDAGANETRLPSPLPVSVAERAYAWLDRAAAEGGDIPKSSAKFLHHSIDADGGVGAANATAASAGIGALHGARGGTTIPEADRRGVYNHLARHLRDAGLEPPPFDLVDAVEMLTAAAAAIRAPEHPPAGWFDEPTELPDIGAVEVTDDGRVFGLLAPAQVAHRGYPDRRVTVPMGNVDYSRWACRQTVCADGKRVITGPVTMECGHAGLEASTAAAADHYDNSCSVVATVAIGENRHGVWVAGALLPDVPPGRVARMLACQLSGDWRAHRDRPGMREFVAALLVPVPGFPFAGARRSVTMSAAAGLTAAAVPVHHRSGPVPVSPAGPVAQPALSVAELRALVHGQEG